MGSGGDLLMLIIAVFIFLGIVIVGIALLLSFIIQTIARAAGKTFNKKEFILSTILISILGLIILGTICGGGI